MRIHNLTGVRAVAALWVVLYHLNLLQTNVHLDLGRLVAHGDSGVDLFFVLSGFVLTMVYADKLPTRPAWSSYRRFILRRFAKIYPLHLLTLLLMFVLFAIGENRHYNFTATGDNTPWTFLCNALMVHAWGLTKALSWNKPSWSVSAEWFAYAVVFMPVAFALRYVRTLYVAVAAIALLATMAMVSLEIGRPWTTFTTNGYLRIVPEFICGYALNRVLRKHALRRGDIVSGAGLIMVVLACYLPYGSLWLLVPGVMTLLAGLHAGGAVVDRVFGNRLFIELGDASYSMYLLQTAVLIAAKQIILRLHLVDTAMTRVSIVLGVMCAVALAGVLSFRLVEEPLRKAILARFGSRGKNPERMPPQDNVGPPSDTEVAATIA